MPAQPVTDMKDSFFTKDAFKALAMTALSQFGRVPQTIHYDNVEALQWRMMLQTRAHIQNALLYWRNALLALHGPQAATYTSFEMFHMLQVVRRPLNEVARRGNECGEPLLKRAQEVCAVLCR